MAGQDGGLRLGPGRPRGSASKLLCGWSHTAAAHPGLASAAQTPTKAERANVSAANSPSTGDALNAIIPAALVAEISKLPKSSIGLPPMTSAGAPMGGLLNGSRTT